MLLRCHYLLVVCWLIAVRGSNGQSNEQQQYACTCTDISPGEEHTCAQQKQWGKCDRQWMRSWDYCSQTCQRCKCFGSETCLDISPNKQFSCSQQKKWGKCDEYWMVSGGFCNITCNRCITNTATAQEEQVGQATTGTDVSTLPAPTPTSLPPTPTPTSIPPTPTPNGGSSKCECTDTSPGRSLSCAQQKAFGKCMRGWMISENHCAQTCGRCTCLPDANGGLTITCTDTPPDKQFTCEQQKQFGKCSQPWMIKNNFCDFTCGRCDVFPQILPSPTPTPRSTPISSPIPNPSPENSLNQSVLTTNLSPQNAESSIINDDYQISTIILSQEPVPQASAAASSQSLLNPSLLSPVSATNFTQQINATDIILIEPPGFDTNISQMISNLTGNVIIEEEEDGDRFCNIDIIDEISNRPQLKIFNQLLTQTGLLKTVTNTNTGITILAPEDQAFREFILAQGITLNDLYLNPNYTELVLPKLIAYHFLPVQITSNRIQSGQSVDTLMGGDDKLIFNRTETSIFVTANQSSAEIIETDITACDISMHVIDSVLLPSEQILSVNSNFSNSDQNLNPYDQFMNVMPLSSPSVSDLLGVTFVPFPPAEIYNYNYGANNLYPSEIATVPDDYILEMASLDTNEILLKDESIDQCDRNVSIGEILSSSGEFQVLERMISELDLDEILEPPVTLFAPIDPAWEVLAIKLQFDSIEEIFLPQNRETLEQIVFYHIVPAIFNIETIKPSTALHSITDQLLFIQKNESQQNFQVRGMGSGANILNDQEEDTFRTYQTCNVSIFKIDGALLPFTILMFNFTDVGDGPFSIPQPEPIQIVVPELVLQTAPPGILDGIVPQDIISEFRDGERNGSFIVNITGDIPTQIMGDIPEQSQSESDTKQNLAQNLNSERKGVQNCPSLLEILKSTPNLSLLQTLVERAEFSTLLDSSETQYTLLAPTDQAIENLISMLGPRSQQLEDNDVLSNILGYHIVQDAYSFDDLEFGMELPTLVTSMGSTVTVLVEQKDVGDALILVGIGNEGGFVEKDVWACDSVVHIIDTVLLPVDTQ